MSFANLFLDKKCLPDDVYEYPNRESWAECEYGRAKYNSYITAVILFVIILIICGMSLLSGKYGVAIAAGVIGTLIIFAVLVAGPRWTLKSAEFEWDKYQLELESYLKSNPGKGSGDFNMEMKKEKLARQKIEALNNQARAMNSRNTNRTSVGVGGININI